MRNRTSLPYHSHFCYQEVWYQYTPALGLMTAAFHDIEFDLLDTGVLPGHLVHNLEQVPWGKSHPLSQRMETLLLLQVEVVLGTDVGDLNGVLDFFLGGALG